MKNNLLKMGVSALAVVVAVSCGNKGNDIPTHPSTTELTVCLASEPDSIDPALNSAVDGASMLVHLEAGLLRYQKEGDKLVLKNDLAKKITKETATVVDHVYNESTGKWDKAEKYTNGTRYTVELRDDIYWNTKDGKGRKITADDFIYSWNRASGSSLAADYGYMFECIADGVAHENDDSEETGQSSLGIKKVEGDTTNTKFTIDLMVDVPYFDQLLAFPVYFPVDKDIVNDEGDQRGVWATSPDTYHSCGAYKLTQWDHNSKIVLEKNPNYWDAEHIVATKLTFALSDDDAAMLGSFKTGEYDLIDSVPNDQIDTLQKNMGKYYHVEGQMGTYYISFNMNSPKWEGKTQEQQAKIRIALAKLIDREYVVKEIGKAGQTPANAFVSSGISDADGKEFVSHNGPNRDGGGYFDSGVTEEGYKKNVEEAIKTLQECGYTYKDGKFTDFPKFTYLYNTGTGHQAIGENLRDTLIKYGIEVELKNEEWNSFLNTRKNGNYDVARNGWVADYDDPSSYLTMWTTASGNNDSQFGKGAHKDVAIYSADIDRDGEKETGLTWAESYDKLVDLSNKEANKDERFKILHEIEDLLMETGGICPIYYYTDIYMVNDHVKGFFTSPLGYKFFHFAQYVNK